jgi:hypothetical protein
MKILKIFVLTILISCTNDIEPMDDWENEMAKELESTRIELSHMKSTTTTNDRLTEFENYLQLKIYDSKKLNDIKHNDGLLTERCNKIHDKILTLPTLTVLPEFNEFRLYIIETHGFWIFKSEETITKNI